MQALRPRTFDKLVYTVVHARCALGASADRYQMEIVMIRISTERTFALDSFNCHSDSPDRIVFVVGYDSPFGNRAVQMEEDRGISMGNGGKL